MDQEYVVERDTSTRVKILLLSWWDVSGVDLCFVDVWTKYCWIWYQNQYMHIRKHIKLYIHIVGLYLLYVSTTYVTIFREEHYVGILHTFLKQCTYISKYLPFIMHIHVYICALVQNFCNLSIPIRSAPPWGWAHEMPEHVGGIWCVSYTLILVYICIYWFDIISNCSVRGYVPFKIKILFILCGRTCDSSLLLLLSSVFFCLLSSYTLLAFLYSPFLTL
jgi:hypothetical protein